MKLHQGWGLLRTASGVIGAMSFGAGYFTWGAAAVKQRKSDEEAALNEARQKLEATTSDILDEEEIQKTAMATDLRVKDFRGRQAPPKPYRQNFSRDRAASKISAC